MTRQTSIFVVGAPRSGTSLACSILQQGSFSIGGEAVPADRRNPAGYFEAREVNQINERILEERARIWPRPLRRYQWNRFFQNLAYPFWTPRGNHFLRPFAQTTEWRLPNSAVASRIQAITAEQPFCLKDPRFCYTLGLWKSGLQADHLKHVCIFRDPRVTARSMLNWPWPLSEEQALKVWESHYRFLLKNHVDDGDWLFCHYDQLSRKAGRNALVRFCGIEEGHETYDRTLNRSDRVDGKLPESVSELYAELCRRAEFAFDL